MTDCPQAEIRDLLPALIAGNLSRAEAVKVEAHVARCRDCSEELALLRTVRQIRPRAVDVDIAAIVARVNSEARLARDAAIGASESEPGLRLVSDNDTGANANRDARNNVKGEVADIEPGANRRRALRSGSWRWAAAVTLIAAGGLSWAIARRGGDAMLPLGRVDSLAGRDSASVVSVAINSPDSAKPAPSRLVTASDGSKVERAALSIGSLSDYTDSELEDVLARLESWDGAASTDPLTPIPIVKPSGGTP